MIVDACLCHVENDILSSFIVGSFALIVVASCLSTPFVVYCAVMIVDAHNFGCQAGCVLCSLAVG